MLDFLGPLAVGILCIVLGVSNMRGNISSLHSYHRKRVREEDRLPFGRLVGLGTVIIGASILLCNFAYLLKTPFFHAVGTAILVVGLIVGLGISFYAMKKYNNGIF